MSYLNELNQIINEVRVFGDSSDKEMSYDDGMEYLVNIFLEHKRKGTTIFFIGNGGSAAIACHMTADFLKNGGMNTCSLYNSSVITCLGNDYGYEYVFSKQLEMLMKEGDLLVAISSSGNSPNIVKAIETAKEKKGRVVSFTGFQADNTAKSMSHVSIYVPCEKYGMVESIHNVMLQQAVDTIMEREKSGKK